MENFLGLFQQPKFDLKTWLREFPGVTCDQGCHPLRHKPIFRSRLPMLSRCDFQFAMFWQWGTRMSEARKARDRGVMQCHGWYKDRWCLFFFPLSLCLATTMTQSSAITRTRKEDKRSSSELLFLPLPPYLFLSWRLLHLWNREKLEAKVVRPALSDLSTWETLIPLCIVFVNTISPCISADTTTTTECKRYESSSLQWPRWVQALPDTVCICWDHKKK